MYRLVICLTLIFLVLPVDTTFAQHSDEDLIKQTVQDAYVQGVFVNRSESVVRSGFHPSFTMAVHVDGELIQATLDMRLERMQLDDVASSDSIRSHIDQVDITGNTAIVKLQLWINGQHTYTDYLGLYKFTTGWKIVNKLFASHDG